MDILFTLPLIPGRVKQLAGTGRNRPLFFCSRRVTLKANDWQKVGRKEAEQII
jgi:hypothetical protein